MKKVFILLAVLVLGTLSGQAQENLTSYTMETFEFNSKTKNFHQTGNLEQTTTIFYSGDKIVFMTSPSDFIEVTNLSYVDTRYHKGNKESSYAGYINRSRTMVTFIGGKDISVVDMASNSKLVFKDCTLNN
jgi:hypothetical protein